MMRSSLSRLRERAGVRAAFAAILLALSLPATAQTLRIGLREDPDVLDPTLGSSYVGRIVYAAMCDKLFDIDANLAIVPQLATGYEWTDPTHLVLHLRQGVTFQDGEPFDAEAVKYKLNRDLTIKGSMRAGEISAIKDIVVRDPATVELVLKAPSAGLLAQLTDRAGIMIAPKAAEAAGDQFGLHPVCAGPFAFESRVAQDRIVLKRFPGYWNAANIHFDEVDYLPQPNSSVRLANLQAGAVDLVEYIVPTDVEAVRRDPKLALAIGDALTYQGITINTGNGPGAHTPIGDQALIRHAFELSIDRKALIDAVLFRRHPAAGPRCGQGTRTAEAGRRDAAGEDHARGAQQPRPAAGRRGDPVHGGRGRVRGDAALDGIRLVLAGRLSGRFPGLQHRLVGPDRPGRQFVAVPAHRRHLQLRPLRRPGDGRPAGPRPADHQHGRAQGAVPAGRGVGTARSAADLSLDAEERGGHAQTGDRVRAGTGRPDSADRCVIGALSRNGSLRGTTPKRRVGSQPTTLLPLTG
jgi:hypothetical protein